MPTYMEITACAVIYPPFCTSNDIVSTFADRVDERAKSFSVIHRKILFFFAEQNQSVVIATTSPASLILSNFTHSGKSRKESTVYDRRVREIVYVRDRVFTIC